jgi:serine protease inhibitor
MWMKKFAKSGGRMGKLVFEGVIVGQEGALLTVEPTYIRGKWIERRKQNSEKGR